MAPIEKDSNEGESKPKTPDWVSEENFLDTIKENVPGFKKILKFEVTPTGGNGENFASVMMRIKVKVGLNDGLTADVCYMLKIVPPGDAAKELLDMLGMYPKEIFMYEKCIPEFEEIFRSAGKQVTFAPKMYKLKKDPGVDYVLLEDISVKGFKNASRHEGLDQEHTESALRLLAAFHAVSATRYATKGKFDPIVVQHCFIEENREIIGNITFNEIFLAAVKTYNIDPKYIQKIKKLQESTADKLMQIVQSDPDKFNVLIHGDMWANNVMFRYSDEGKHEETMFIDFQICVFASPVLDLFYFLLSSVKFDIKLPKFDYFVRYYYDQLVENLQFLKYPKSIPTYKDLQFDLLENSFWVYWTITGVLSVSLMEPSEEANIDLFIDGEGQKDFRFKMYTNPKFVKHVEALLPWMDARGFLS